VCRRFAPHLLFLFVCVLWGSNFMLMKRASSAFGPISIGGWRVFSGAAVLCLLWRIWRQPWPFCRRQIGPLAFVALIGYAWPFAIQPLLISRYGGAFIGMMVSLVPLLTVLASIPMLGCRPLPRQLIGVIGGLGFAGLILGHGLKRSISLGDLALALTVPVSYAVTNVYIKRRLADMSPLTLTVAALTGAGAALLPIGVVAEPIRAGARSVDAIASLLFLGLVGTGLANYGFNTLIRERGPLFAGMVSYLVPVVAMVWGWIDSESISPIQIVALVGILFMVALAQSAPASGWTSKAEPAPAAPGDRTVAGSGTSTEALQSAKP
jgi:drug/metabolite transporter (DMT)-like permease